MTALPAAMAASYVVDSGSDTSLRLGPLPVPTPGPGQALVRVEAAALDRVDTYIRRGTHGMSTDGPTVLGRDLSGTVVALGPSTGDTRIQVGDRVLGLGTATHAEYAVAPTTHLVPQPAGWTPAECAALPTAGRTAVDAVVNLAGVGPGDTVLVVAAAGAVGSFAVQYARHRGARVLGTAGSPGKRDAVRALGAEAAFDHYDPALVEQLREHTGGRGLDVVVESAGGSLWSELLGALAPFGRMITCGVTAGSRGSIHLGRLMVQGWTLRGVGRPRPEVVAAHLRQAVDISVAAGVAPVVHQVLPLAEAAAAHELLESSDFVGRIVLSTT